TLGEAARIRLVLSEAEKPEETAVSPQNSYLENRERYFAALENPLVAEIQKVFGVKVKDVR
ncbi:MAG: hypothetical protein LBH00_02550, partial [Planctomycetaceae bacterium]|nr:hypothetical protein [Planctomycetaceae bacterium]